MAHSSERSPDRKPPETTATAKNDQITVSGKIITVQLKAYIARNMLDNKGFYPIWQEIDRTLLDALAYLENK